MSSKHYDCLAAVKFDLSNLVRRDPREAFAHELDRHDAEVADNQVGGGVCAFCEVKFFEDSAGAQGVEHEGMHPMCTLCGTR